MFDVSLEYKQAMRSAVHRRRIRGKIGNVEFTENNILDGSLEITNQMSESTAVSLGGVYIGQLKATFLRNLNVNRGSWQGLVITLSDELLIDEGADTWESVPLGVFTVNEAIWSAEGVSVTAYDNMSKLDKPCNVDATAGKIYDFLQLVAKECKVELAQTAADLARFPNAGEDLALFPENDIETWRDFVHWVALTCSAFATFNRYGELELRLLGVSTGEKIPPRLRYQGGQFSDFSSYYTGISFVNIEAQTTSYYSVKPDNGLTMNLGPNPFLQYGLASTLKAQRTAILNQLTTFRGVPFSIQMLGDPAYDLGDLIVFENGIAGAQSAGCIMFYDYVFGDNYSIAGYGENPALATAQSKLDKEISGLSSKSQSNKITYYQYTNAEEINLGNVQSKVASIRFATETTSDVDIWHEFKLDTLMLDGSDRIVGKVFYYLNGEMVTYQPIETWAIDGYHILNLNYHLANIENTSSNLWEVFLELEGGAGSIGIGDANVVLGGQGMAGSDEWNGLLELEESFGSYMVKGLEFESFVDDLDFKLVNNSRFIFDESINGVGVKALEVVGFGGNLFVSFEELDYFTRMSSAPEAYAGDLGLL